MNWQETIKRSKYHFDKYKFDKEVDKINKLGKFIGDFTNVNSLQHNKIKKIQDLFVLKNCTETIETLASGQLIQLTLDDFEEINSEAPWRVVKIIVHLTDWEQGQFCNYGNYMHYQWKAGDTYSYDWQNIPYSMANASQYDMLTYQLVGILTDQSDEFINRLKRFNTYNLDL